jgi:hypothetical protein
MKHTRGNLPPKILLLNETRKMKKYEFLGKKTIGYNAVKKIKSIYRMTIRSKHFEDS